MAKAELIICDFCGKNAPWGVGDRAPGWVRIDRVDHREARAKIFEGHFCSGTCTAKFLHHKLGLGEQLLLTEDDEALARIRAAAERFQFKESEAIFFSMLMEDMSRIAVLNAARQRTRSIVFRDKLVSIAAMALCWLRLLEKPQEPNTTEDTED